MKSERRRLVVEEIFERFRQAGIPMDTDLRFLKWIEQWVAGEIEMPQVRQNYLQLLQERASQQKSGDGQIFLSSQEDEGERQSLPSGAQQVSSEEDRHDQ